MIDYRQALKSVTTGYGFSMRKGVGIFSNPHFDLFSNEIMYGFTSRIGGVSEGPFATLNLAINKEDRHSNTIENFRRFSEAIGVHTDDLVMINYEHGNNVERVDAQDNGKGVTKEELPFCDGLVTGIKGLVLLTSNADCSVIYCYDPAKRAVGIAHAGWKGMLGRIGGNMIAKLVNEYGSDPKNIHCLVGPTICQDCFEVDEKLGKKFIDEFSYSDCCKPGKTPDKLQLDLTCAAAIQLIDAEIQPQNISIMHACTFELEDKLFSHRRDKGLTGSMCGYISII